jgi:hypothetical protein
MGSDAPKSALIVGSGPVGAVYARLLVDGGWTVTMLEAGAVLSDPPGEHLANAFVFQRQPNLFMDVTAAGFERYSVPQKILRNLRYRYRRNYENPKQRFFRNMMFASAVYGVGGMSTIWTAACPPHEDFELSPLIPLAEWRRLLAVADGMLSVSDTTFADAPLAPILMARCSPTPPSVTIGSPSSHSTGRKDSSTMELASAGCSRATSRATHAASIGRTCTSWRGARSAPRVCCGSRTSGRVPWATTCSTTPRQVAGWC